MKVLVINCGSSSLKYQVFDMNREKSLAKGKIERIGTKKSKLKHEKLNSKEGLKEVVIEKEVKNHMDGISLAVGNLMDNTYGVIGKVEEIEAVGHRVVHGGEKFSQSVIIDNNVLRVLEECKSLAPLHNPSNIAGILAAKEIFTDKPHIGVFDTAFHQSMEEKSFLYGLPYEFYEKYGIRKYGFHGVSHQYVAKRAAEFINIPLEKSKLITCHLGNGASVSAIDGAVSVDTSMGFTPLEGLVMGTRVGDIDPSIVTYLIKEKDLAVEEINNLLNKESGVLGISGISNDFRDLEKAWNKGEKRGKLALDVFIYRVMKYIGSYIMVLGGVDGLVFTAGVGENSPFIRRSIVEYLNFLGIKIDQEKNQAKGAEKDISARDSSAKVLVIPTNEELMIARETKNLFKT